MIQSSLDLHDFQDDVDEDAPILAITAAAELAGMHPQTLRQYDRLGLVSPDRTAGRGRRYSARDIVLLREVQRLSQEDGVNLAGIKRILELELQVEALQHKVSELLGELDVGVGEHQERPLPAELAREGDDAPRRRGADVHRGLGRAGEGDPPDAGMARERRAGLLPDPLDDVEDDAVQLWPEKPFLPET